MIRHHASNRGPMRESSVKLHDIVVRSILQADGTIDCGTAFAISLAQHYQALLTSLVYEIRIMARREGEAEEAREGAELAVEVGG